MLLIDRKEMQVVFKHRDKATCESQRKNGHTYLVVDETEENGFRGFTQLEMKFLYHNLGQIPGTVITNATSVKNAVVRLLKYRPDNIPKENQSLPLYNEATAAAITKTAQAVIQSVTATIAPTGNTIKLIWDVADELWAKAGSPKDPKDVLRLRKDIMVELENVYHVKKNTASNELGKWSKARI